MEYTAQERAPRAARTGATRKAWGHSRTEPLFSVARFETLEVVSPDLVRPTTDSPQPLAIIGRSYHPATDTVRLPDGEMQGRHLEKGTPPRPSAVSSSLLCNHDGAWPHETVQRRRAGGGEPGQRIALRSPLSAPRTGRVSKPHCTRDGLKLH